jgi:hypothetical protein
MWHVCQCRGEASRTARVAPQMSLLELQIEIEGVSYESVPVWDCIILR